MALVGEQVVTDLVGGHSPHDPGGLEDAASDLPRYNTTGLSGAYWLRVLDRLAREYRSSGRNEDSETINRRIRELLAHADVDHPLLVQTKTK